MINYIHHNQLKVPSRKSLVAASKLSAFGFKLLAKATKGSV